jgi:hypothetical protein
MRVIVKAWLAPAIVAGCVLLAGRPDAGYAGTTGSLSGTVQDSQTGAPIIAAKVTATSPSQSSTTYSDRTGRYVFLSLIPDTYTLSAAKDGYETARISGISVFADQSQDVALRLLPSPKTLGTVRITARSSLSPVRPGTTTDVYSVNTAMTAAAATLGGGGGLNNAYSGIASMPGAFVPPNQFGVNQTVYVRGGYYDQIGYEYDGVPMNRSFDNYPSHSASTTGQEELQIYTGGGSASSDATGLSGFVNQVVKSGTYPGYANFSSRVGSPTFYNDLSLETGGSAPDRLFSYYVGISGFNQGIRYLDQFNGADLVNEFPAAYPSNITTNLPFWPAVYPNCDPSNPNLYANPATAFIASDPGCFGFVEPNIDFPSSILGRESVGNFHVGLPHKRDNGRDDIQLLYANSTQFLQYYSSIADAGALLTRLQSPALNYAYDPAIWPDFYTYPSGTQFLHLANVPVIGYAFPGSPANRCLNQAGWIDFPLDIPGSCPISQSFPYNAGTAALPLDYRDGRWDQASVMKAQYQDNISDSSYLRVFGYLFYSNTNRSGAVQEGITGPFGSVNLGGTNYDYEIGAHTRGGQVQYANQISSKHELTATLNYVESRTLRYYNFNDFNTGTQQVSNLTNGTQCFAAYAGTLANGDNVNAGQPAPCNDPITQGDFEAPTTIDPNSGAIQNITCSGGVPSNPGGFPVEPIPTPACAAGAAWRLTFTGNQAEINAIKPELGNASVSDEWKPNDRLDVTASLRFDRDEYVIAPVSDPGKDFWYAAARKEFCYDPVTFQPALIPQPPQFLHDVSPWVGFSCPGTAQGLPRQTVHPDGLNGHIYLSDAVPPTYTQSYFQPRFGLTYNLDPNTVLRFSAGRFAQEPQNYEVEYNSLEPNLAAELIGFIQFGYNTPFHAAGAQFSNNYDASLEHQFAGTDVAFKLTPYYRWATDQLYETVSIPTLFGVSPSFNSGTERVDGVELELTKGDFNKNGFSGYLSYTYTNAAEKWNNYAGVPINPVDPYNQDIENFNALTKAGGGAPCYANSGDGTPDFGCSSSSILNPYYNMRPQPLLDKNGWYTPGLDFPYISPNTFAAVLNYRVNKFAITPALSLNEGATYGTPADFQGLDPRTCTANQASEGIAGAANPLTADYTSCSHAAVGSSGTNPGYLWIPNPYTGTFDTFGQFRQPWQFNLGLQLQYQVSPKITANISAVNLVNSCFGGSSEPWTKVYPPNGVVCGYGYNKFFISNFYNGSNPNDVAANGVPLNPYFSVPFAPAYGDVNSFNLPTPLQLYFQLQFKM